MNFDLTELLNEARGHDASDLHLCCSTFPFIRRYKEIHFFEMDALTAARTEAMILSCLETEAQKRELFERNSLSFACTDDHGRRYRTCIYRQSRGWDAVFHLVPEKIRGFDELGLPAVIKTLAAYPNGIILVCGPAGSGKTATLNALIDYINHIRHDHVITVENPIEFVHTPLHCQVTQRELGRHTRSYPDALRAALREDPDVIVVSEINDQDTMDMALSASETGHLVIGTLNTRSAVQAVNAVIDFFPADQQESKRGILAETIRGIICQELLPIRTGKGLAAAYEIIVRDIGLSNLIKKNLTQQISSLIQTGKSKGMVSMEDSIKTLVKAGAVAAAALDPTPAREAKRPL